MYFHNTFLVAAVTYVGVTAAQLKNGHTTRCPTPSPTTAAPPPGNTYVTTYPICAVAGETVVPGPYAETIYKSSNSTVAECVSACIATAGCESIAFADVYKECLFFDRMARNVQLIETGGYFVHWDLGCF